MEIGLIQSYINNILVTNNINIPIKVYSDQENVIKIEPIGPLLFILQGKKNIFKAHILDIINYVIKEGNLNKQVDIKLEYLIDQLIINIIDQMDIFEYMPLEVMKDSLLNNKYSDIKNFCSTNSQIKQICDDNNFWRNKYIHDYGKPPPEYIDNVEDVYSKQGYLYINFIDDKIYVAKYNGELLKIKKYWIMREGSTISIYIIDENNYSYIWELSKKDNQMEEEISRIPLIVKDIDFMINGLIYVDGNNDVYTIINTMNISLASIIPILKDAQKIIDQSVYIPNVKGKKVTIGSFNRKIRVGIIDLDNVLHIINNFNDLYKQELYENIKYVDLGYDYNYYMNSDIVITTDSKFKFLEAYKEDNNKFKDIKAMEASYFYMGLYILDVDGNFIIYDKETLKYRGTFDYVYFRDSYGIRKYKDGIYSLSIDDNNWKKMLEENDAFEAKYIATRYNPDGIIFMSHNP